VTSNGQHALSASGDHTLKLWDLEEGVEVRTLAGHEGPVQSMAVTADGRRAVSASDDALKLWDLELGTEVCTLAVHADKVEDVAMSSDGWCAVSASQDGTLKLWDLDAGQILASFTAESAIQACACSSGSLVFVAYDTLGRFHVLELVEPGNDMPVGNTGADPKPGEARDTA
jgi:WD40 repeat protein